MLMPRLWNDSFFDNWMDELPKTRFYTKTDSGLMKTDVKETADGYQVKIDLPGFEKENVKAQLEDGYLIVTAVRQSSHDEKDENEKYIRRERYQGSVSRSYYVGDNVTENDIKAKFDNGILTLEIPKIDQPKMEEKKFIEIEG